jgi:hypothetical protein
VVAAARLSDGAALSPALGGAIAEAVGYRITFIILGAYASGSVALWLGFRSLVRPACNTIDDAVLALSSGRSAL